MFTIIDRFLNWLSESSLLRFFGSGSQDTVEDRHFFELALLESLNKSPNVVLYIFVITVPSTVLTYGQVNGYFQILWLLISFAIGTAVELRVRQFAKLTQEERDADREKWVWFAEYSPSIFGMTYCVYLVPVFPLLDHSAKIYMTLIGVGLLSGSMGHYALATRFQTAFTLICMSYVWLFWGEQTYTYVVLLWSFMGFYGYMKGQRFQANATIKRVMLTEKTRLLSQELLGRNAQLERLNREKNFLLASASHDLRQPVHALGLLIANWKAEESIQYHQHRIGIARSRIDLLSHMLKSVLDVTQLELGVYPTDIVRFNLRTMLEEVFQEHEYAARAKGLRPVADLTCTRGLDIKSDHGLLGRIIGNLLSNAVKYTQNGQVVMRAERLPDGGICIYVEDSGVGIPSDRYSDIFRSYARLEASKSNNSGMGIGLSIVQKGTRLLNLEVGLTSQIGIGSKFFIRVPGSQIFYRESQQVMQTSLKSLTGVRIAIVDDDEVICNATGELLEGFGATALCALETQVLLSKIQANGFEPDLLIADYQLAAGATGVECIETVRGVLGLANLPAILLTGDVLVSFPESLSNSCTQLMHKPLSASRLRDGVIGILKEKDSI